MCLIEAFVRRVARHVPCTTAGASTVSKHKVLELYFFKPGYVSRANSARVAFDMFLERGKQTKRDFYRSSRYAIYAVSCSRCGSFFSYHFPSRFDRTSV